MLKENNCSQYLEKLSSDSPVPGGGGASAYVGALGAALASMVANLTSGKLKFEYFQENLDSILERANYLVRELESLSEQDAEAFLPLSQAYSMSKDNPDRERIMECALKNAAEVPYKILQKCNDVISLHEELLNNSSKLVVSDIGTGVAFVKSAIEGAFLNVLVNTNLMKDSIYATQLNCDARDCFEKGRERADKVYSAVEKQLWK